VETARRVLAAAGRNLPLAADERLREIRFGDAAGLPRNELEAAFNGAFNPAGEGAVEAHRFLGGESIAELLDRVLPAWDDLLQRDDWRCLLLVLHGGVNRALLARVLTGRRGFIGHFEQAPGCINVIDVGSDDAVLRAVNLTPLQWLQHGESMTATEKLLAQFLKSQVS
jgi:probable phosphoglycerate mutase